MAKKMWEWMHLIGAWRFKLCIWDYPWYVAPKLDRYGCCNTKMSAPAHCLFELAMKGKPKNNLRCCRFKKGKSDELRVSGLFGGSCRCWLVGGLATLRQCLFLQQRGSWVRSWSCSRFTANWTLHQSWMFMSMSMCCFFLVNRPNTRPTSESQSCS